MSDENFKDLNERLKKKGQEEEAARKIAEEPHVYYPWESNGSPAEGRNENIFFSLKLLCCPKLGIC